MKKVILSSILSLLVFESAQAGQRLLHCNVNGGDLQSIAVERGLDSKLMLLLLRTSGRMVTLPLLEKDWSARRIRIKTDYGAGEFYFQDGQWWYDFREPGVREFGNGDCR